MSSLDELSALFLSMPENRQDELIALLEALQDTEDNPLLEPGARQKAP